MVFYIMINLSTNDILRMTVIEKSKKKLPLRNEICILHFLFFFFIKTPICLNSKKQDFLYDSDISVLLDRLTFRMNCSSCFFFLENLL